MQISGVGLEKMNEFMYSPITERAPVPHIFGTLVSARRFPSAPRQLAGASVVMLWLLIFLLSWVPQTMGQEDDLNDDNLVELWIDELLKVEITSVSKKAKKRVEAAAAIYVLSEESIRPSRANIPDLLRTVPGPSAARIDG